MEKVDKVNGAVKQVLGLLHLNTKDIGCIDEGEQEVITSDIQSLKPRTEKLACAAALA